MVLLLEVFRTMGILRLHFLDLVLVCIVHSFLIFQVILLLIDCIIFLTDPSVGSPSTLLTNLVEYELPITVEVSIIVVIDHPALGR